MLQLASLEFFVTQKNWGIYFIIGIVEVFSSILFCIDPFDQFSLRLATISCIMENDHGIQSLHKNRLSKTSLESVCNETEVIARDLVGLIGCFKHASLRCPCPPRSLTMCEMFRLFLKGDKKNQ